MQEQKGIDIFNFISALLVIAAHASPLGSYTETYDFILTRVIVRVAVPFFFMATGYFLISNYRYDISRLCRFIKRLLLIYIISIAIYLPINIHDGYFDMEHLLPNMLKDLFFDGTFYHLWYMPAAAFGAMIAWVLVRKLGYGGAFAITALLYVIGLGGDSYFGLSEAVPFLNDFYSAIFEISDYTKCGLFMSPIFFVMGGFISDGAKERQPGKILSLILCAASLALMIIEALTLRSHQLQRYDSMYIFLLPCVFFLFNFILCFKGKRSKVLGIAALVVYIIHPLIIIAIGFAGRLAGLERLFIENSLVHYVLVCMVSSVIALAFAHIASHFKRKTRLNVPTVFEVDTDNLKNNVEVLQGAMRPGCKLLAVIKANSYGHGSEMALSLQKMGVDTFAVATINEGIEFRLRGLAGQILVFGYTDPSRAGELKKYRLTQTLISSEYANALNATGISLKAHLKLDTGMHRLGFDWEDKDTILAAFKLKNIRIEGMYSHLCTSDSLDIKNVDFSQQQIQRFNDVYAFLESNGITGLKKHIQASYGLLNYPDLDMDYARMGIALYGLLSDAADKTLLRLPLKPVLRIKSRVVLIRKIKAGDSCSYGRVFDSTRDTTLAVIPIGYADGIPRSLSGVGYAIINGQKAPIAGRICMDQMMLDVTDIPDVEVGSEAVFMDTLEMATEGSTITNEILSRLGGRPLRNITHQ